YFHVTGVQTCALPISRADERVHRAVGSLPTEQRREFEPDLERGARRLVVDAGRLEHDLLVGPAHRPVDLPDELARAEVAQQDRQIGRASCWETTYTMI